MADYSFYEYQRLVQKEAEPDLIVHLPDRSDDTAQANVPQPEMESEDATMQAHVELAVTVAFEVHQPKCGLRFHGAYAYTDNQVHKCLNTVGDIYSPMQPEKCCFKQKVGFCQSPLDLRSSAAMWSATL